MSIPPLVCSTPPPPDQCDDDKDPEDFDISYSLSQEEDDDENNGYDYGNFSSYNHYQSACDNKPLESKDQEITKSIDVEIHKEIYMQYEHTKETEQSGNSHEFGTNDINENKLKCEEDINIEDLNLKLDEEITTNIDNTYENESIGHNSDSLKDLNIPCNSNNSSQDDDTNISSYEHVISPSVDTKQSCELYEASFDQSSDVKTNCETEVDNVDLNYLQDTDNKIPSHLNECALSSTEPDISLKHMQEPAVSPSHINEPLFNEPASTSHTHEPVVSLGCENATVKSEDILQISDEFPEESPESLKQSVIESNENVDDDFGEFDDFQFVNTESKVTSIVDSLNPWENEVPPVHESDFGNFTAHFEENRPTQDLSLETRPITPDNKVREENNLEDDDFGDFDDFKSSAVGSESKEVQEQDLCQELPVLNLQSNDNEHHIMESITKVLTSVFVEEIMEPEVEFEGKLESLLSETWGYLMETDERQPYIVNWNNSLGQKTLLKALCIDARNILFGPKWSSHMPKYAANLSVAPLQPQKQTYAPSNAPQPEAASDKASSKPTAWSDPFTSDGQEFTYAEALLLDLEHLMATLDQMAHNHSTLKISELLSHACNTENESSTVTSRPLDLDVFEAAMPSKSEKIYSSTLGVQPIRQINLPDTHIFTPTDSEIPRSKTIHYDRGPAVLLPIVADSKNPTDNPPTENTANVDETNTEDNEYWEFQDFKSTPESTSLPGLPNQTQIHLGNNDASATTVNVLPKPSIAYQTQLLQPIKVEPSMPTLNWPDPGEVKVPYDDFTDFVSISSQTNESQDGTIIKPQQSETKTNTIMNSENFNAKTETTFPVVTKPGNVSLDDDFDTFQSALPSKDADNDFKMGTFGNSGSQMPMVRPSEFDYTYPKTNNMKSDSISFVTMPRPGETVTQNVSNNSTTAELANKNTLLLSTPTSILHPTHANSSTHNSQNQRTTGQILQPLSLESYSQINWPSPGIDLQDLSRFNPVETLQSLKSDLSVSGLNKVASPVHTQKNTVVNQASDEDVWGEFVSSKPKQPTLTKKPLVVAEDDEWTDFISSPSVKPQNGLNTISLNVHTNSNIQKSVHNKFSMKKNQTPVDIPTLNYITPKSNPHKSYNDKHFQNL